MPVKSKIEKCEKCGLPWIGTDRCECGWTPDQHVRIIKGVLIVTAVLGLIALVYVCEHLHYIFPDERAAEQHITKGDDDLHRGDFPEAVEEYKTAAQYSPKRAQIREKIAVALLNVQRPGEALEQLQQAHDLAPGDMKIAKELVVLLEQNSHDDQAAKVLETVVKGEPKDSLLRYHLAEVYEKAGNLKEAASLYSAYSHINPRVNGPWLGLARVQENEHKDSEAIATLRTALTYLPQDGILHQRLGALLGKNKQNAEAAKELTRSAELAPALGASNSALIASFASGGKQEQYFIPLTKRGDQLMVEVVLNERSKVHLVVNPAAEAVVVSPAVMHGLGIPPAAGTPIVIQTNKGPVGGHRVNLDSFRLGAAKELLVPAVVAPVAGIDGILGMSFLSRYDYSIDPKGNQLILRRRSD